jgi:hypothetical protein
MPHTFEFTLIDLLLTDGSVDCRVINKMPAIFFPLEHDCEPLEGKGESGRGSTQ